MDLLLHERNSAFDHSLWSRYEWLSYLNHSQRLTHYHRSSQRKYEYSFPQDAYYALAGEAPNESPIGEKWMEVMQQDYYPELVKRFDKLNSRINTTLFLSRKFEEHYLTPPPPPPPRSKGAKQQQINQEQDQEPASDKELSDAQADVGDDQQQGEGDTQANPDAGPGQGEIKQDVAPMQITEEELAQLDQENEAYEDMSGLLAGTGMSPKSIRQWIEHNFDRYMLERVAELVGFGERVMDGAKRQNKGAVGEFTGYRPGGWGANTIPMDRVGVTTGSKLALARLADRKLTNRKYKAERPAGKGAAVFLHDESSSMTRPVYSPHGMVRKDVQAINLQLALGSLFLSQSRPYSAIAWSANTTRFYEYGTLGLEGHLGQFLGGGTRLGHALHKALDFITSRPEYAQNADILIGSDGEIDDYPASDTALMEKIEAFKANGGRIWFILIGANLGFSYAEKLKGIIDFYFEAQHLYSSEGMEKIMAGMATDRQEHASYEV